MVLDAPGRLSTTTGCFSCAASLSETMRAITSVPPPGAAPTIRRTGRVSCAQALVVIAAATVARPASAPAIRVFIAVSILLSGSGGADEQTIWASAIRYY
ncbi:hypothetical protein D3C72_1779090 [compost metagenome]